MASDFTINPVNIDTQGDASTVRRQIQGISIRASADDWVVTLSDADGEVIFDRESKITNDRGEYIPFPAGLNANGITATTLTNITRVLVYCIER